MAVSHCPYEGWITTDDSPAVLPKQQEKSLLAIKIVSPPAARVFGAREFACQILPSCSFLVTFLSTLESPFSQNSRLSQVHADDGSFAFVTE